tara:strand:+ start:78 stop:917 length:840 start_codon:yes stop_codon:yes gene_type:complete
MNPVIGAAVAKATALGAKYGPKAVMAGQKLASYFSKEGAKKLGQQAVKAATSEGAKQAGKRALRDTVLYSAAEQVIPRALGQQAPDIKDTLVRQAAGNIIAEGATAGLTRAFPMPKGGGLLDASGKAMKPQDKGLFGLPGMKPGDARKIGEVTGQIGGQAIAQTVLPGEQANPFLPSTYMQEEEGIPLGVGPTTATGATKFTAEPEYAEVVRPSTTDLSNIQASEAMAERERYAYELQLAQIKNQPKHTYMHYESANPAVLGSEIAGKTFSNMKIPQYG